MFGPQTTLPQLSASGVLPLTYPTSASRITEYQQK